MIRNNKKILSCGVFCVLLYFFLLGSSSCFAEINGNGQTDVGIRFTENAVPPANPTDDLGIISTAPTSKNFTNLTGTKKEYPKTGEIINLLMSAWGVGLLFLLLIYKRVQKNRCSSNAMEEGI